MKINAEAEATAKTPSEGASEGASWGASIDLHCHLLPSWDDGAHDVGESLRMAREACEAGVSTIVTTPHVGRAFGKRRERPARDIAAAAEALQAQIREAGIPLAVVAGAEVTMETLLEMLEASRPADWGSLSLGGAGSFVLVESAFGNWPMYADRVLYQVGLSGLTPIIAHPERLPEVQKNPSVLDEALNGGAVLQLTARALLGRDGPRVKECCRHLLKAAPSVVIASDAHAAPSVWPGQAAQVLAGWMGEEAARHILSENPQRILAGKACRPLPASARGASASGRAEAPWWKRWRAR